MAMIKNQVIADAIKAAFATRTVVLPLGVTDERRDLNASGAGDTIQITNWKTITETLENMPKGHRLTPEQLSQGSFSVLVEQFGKAIEIFDQDVQFSVSGGSADAEATRQLTEIFVRHLDKVALDALLDTTLVKDATAGLTGKLVLEALFENYGENGLEAAKALVIPSVMATQIINDEKYFVGVDKYAATMKGEIGKVFNKLPVIVSDRIEKDTDNSYQGVIVPENSLAYFLGKDVNLETERDILAKSTVYSADYFYGMTKLVDSVKIKMSL